MTQGDENPLQPVGDRRLPGLDGLRAISIAFVLLGHSWATVPLPAGVKDRIGPYVANAPLGVRVFFVLSGYLITCLLRREYERTGRIHLAAFYARRTLRIFPALYTYLAVVCVLTLIGVLHVTSGDLIRAATFVTNYGFLMRPESNSDYWFVGHFWTLALEEQFYLLWPLTLVWLGLRRGRWVAVGVVCLTPAVRVGSYFVWPDARPHLGMMLHTGADPILTGCLAGLIEDLPIVRRAVHGRTAGLMAGLAALFVLVPSAFLAERFRGAYLTTVGYTLDTAMLAFVLLYVVNHPAAPVVRFLEKRPMRDIGVMSYSLYLWQQLFLTTPAWPWAPFPMNLVAAGAAALLSNRLIERPFLKLRSRFKPSGGAKKPEHSASQVALPGVSRSST